MERRGVIEKDVLEIIYTSATFPTTGYGHAHNLHPELVAKIKSAFWSFDFESDATFKSLLKQSLQGSVIKMTGL